MTTEQVNRPGLAEQLVRLSPVLIFIAAAVLLVILAPSWR